MRTTTRFVALALMSATLALAQEEFSQRLTPDERKAAGLDQLSAEQIAALDALVARDQRPAPAPAANPVAAKSSRAMPAEAAPSAPAPERRRVFGLPVKEEAPGTAITGTLVGEFRGWTGATMFQLDDGSTWLQEDPTDVRPQAPRPGPHVKIQKSMFGGYKLTVDGDPAWVRVRRVQ